MESINLVTTGLKSTINKNCKNIFLGEWCILYTNKDLQKIDKDEVLDYHWDDREKFTKDFYYIKTLKEKISKSLYKKLNEYHKKKNSDRYWEIIIDPWLTSFLQVYIERYENILNLFRNKKIHETIILKIDENLMLPRSYEEYSKLITTDTWNHFIFSEIIEHFNKSHKFTINYLEFIDEEKFDNYLKNFPRSLRQKFYNFFVRSLKFFIKKEKILISESYLGKTDEIKLNLKLGLIPKLDVYKFNQKFEKNTSRENFILDFETSNDFEVLIKKNIIKHIPLSFIEQFYYIENLLDLLVWPDKPKIIFTSHCMSRTLQSRYVAEKIEKYNTKLIHGQHGGVYGQSLFTSAEDYELNICDKYITWGWQKDNNIKIIPFGILKKVWIKPVKKPKKILLILKNIARYTHRLHAGSGSNQTVKYLNNCIDYTQQLNPKLLKDLIIRTHARKYENYEDKKFRDKINANIEIDTGNQNIRNLLNKSKLVVHTYLSTGYLESLYLNIPTIIFFDKFENALRDDCKKYMKYLKEANILHDNFQSAANFTNNNWENIDVWWNSNSTKKAVNIFNNVYAKKQPFKINLLKDIIKKEL